MKVIVEWEGINFMLVFFLVNCLNFCFMVENILLMIYDLVSKGFVVYDLEMQEIEMKDKIYYYVNVEAGNVDYDYLCLVF